MTVSVSFPYHKSSLELEVPRKNLKALLVPKKMPPRRQTEEQMVLDALENPLGTPKLRHLAADKTKITLITSDHTRAVPSHITLPILLREIRAGNPDATITILIATGLHRETTREEILQRFGREIAEKERIVVHNVERTHEMVPIGQLPSGCPCSINRLAVEADLLVCEGFIEPHFFAGFSGGRKSILPGISSRETVNANHSARAIAHPLAKTGVLSGNPIHEDMVYAAREAGVDFILNVLQDEEKKIIHAVAGDVEKAHLEGCRKVWELCGTPPATADIVMTSNGGYPLDQNLYQAPKSIATARECANPGGIIIAVAACAEGMGGENFERLMLMGSPRKMMDYLLSLSDEETISEQWCNQIFAKIMLDHQIILVSELDPEILRKMGFLPAKTPREALDLAFQIKGTDASVTVIPDGVAVIVGDSRI